MKNNIPEKALVAMPEFATVPLGSGTTLRHQILDPKQATVSFYDRSFHFGDSIYEVVRTYDGILFCAEEHLRRLKASMAMAEFESPVDIDEVSSVMKKTAKAYTQKFGNEDLYIRVIVSRGFSDTNIDTEYSSPSHFSVYVRGLQPLSREKYKEGFHLAVVERRRNHPLALDPAMKSGNYLNNILALNEAKRMGAVDAILLNLQGFVTEATTSNIFAVRDGVVWTAPLDVGILAGITRDWVMDVCKELGIGCEERLFSGEALKSCEEVFLSSSLKEVLAITKLNNAPVGNGKPGPVTLALADGLRKKIESYCQARSAETLWQ